MKFDIDRWINFVLIGEILSCSYLQLVYMRALCTNTPAIYIYTHIEGKTCFLQNMPYSKTKVQSELEA